MQFNFAVIVSALAATAFAAPVAETSPVEGLSRRAGYSGDVTYYTPGLGSCGKTNTEADHIVALSVPMMANGANPNANPKCGKNINIKYGGKTFSAKVVDTCQACAYGSIDVTPSLFKAMTGSLNAGRLHNVQWSFA